jgi:16S rRNA processing protein RimM
VLVIGEIVGPHGVRGEVKVYPLTDFPQRFSQLTQVSLRKGGQARELHLARVRTHKNIVLLEFREITSRNQAEELRGWELVIPYQQAVSLPRDHFYDHQLEGLQVYRAEGDQCLGRLTEVLHLPANAVYRVSGPDGREVLIPALKSVVRQVDLVQGRMYVSLPEGMLE